MNPGWNFSRNPKDDSGLVTGVKQPRPRLEFEQPSQDCLILFTPRRLAVAAAITKAFIIAFIYLTISVLLTGAGTFSASVEQLFHLAQANFLVLVILLAPLALGIPLLEDLRLIFEGRRITFDKTHNVVLLNRRRVAALDDLTHVRISGERVQGGVRYHLTLVFLNGQTVELDNRLEKQPLEYPAQTIASFLKVPLQ